MMTRLCDKPLGVRAELAKELLKVLSGFMKTGNKRAFAAQQAKVAQGLLQSPGVTLITLYNPPKLPS